MSGTGLNGSVGLAAETTYGTYVAPTKFVEPVAAVPLKKVKNAQQGGGLAAGRLVQPGSKRVVTTEAGTVTLPLELTRTGLGILLQHAFGGSAAPVQQAATAAWLQTHVLADNVGKSLTVQSGVPETGGTVRPYTGKGGKVTSLEIVCGVDEIAMITTEVDLRQVSEVETLAAPSYVSRKLFHFGQMSVKVGTFGAEVAVSGVKKVTFKLERGQDVARFYAGAGGLKAEPLGNEFVKVSATIDFDFVDKTVFADRFASDAPTSVVIDWTGDLIAAANYERLTIKLPQVFVDGETPALDGPGVVSNSVPLIAQNDGTNPTVTCEYMSIDTTL